AAFGEAQRQGATWIEFDVRLAGCGTPVVLHDATLDRTTAGGGPVRDLDVGSLGNLDAGSWFAPVFATERVPTLGATLKLAAELGLGCNVEVKAESDAAAATTAAAVAPLLAVAPVPVVVSSFVETALFTLRRISEDVALGLLVEQHIDERHLEVAADLGAVSLHADRRAFREGVSETLRERGLHPVAYTVNDVDEARRLHRQLGVATLITDRPRTLLAGLATAQT
ncbi:MAG: glycerophosphodiester phosphodiesterase family protein, partial [Pseudomonadota bacterium]